MFNQFENNLRRLFEKNSIHFSEGGRFYKFRPLFEAVETIFFTPAIPARRPPFVRDGIDLKRFMSIVLLALMPPLIFGIYNTGYQSQLAGGNDLNFFNIIISGLLTVMPLIIVSYAAGFFWEILFSIIRKHPISEGFLVTGLLFPMTLPPTVPLWQVAVGISFGVVIGKEVFGGTGRNIFNPALTARAFLFFAYPAKMSGDRVWVAVSNTASTAINAVSGATPLSVTTLASSFENIESMLQSAGFTLTTLFAGNYPGSVGGTSALCCLIGALVLIITGVASYRIIIGGVAGLLSTSFLLGIVSTAHLNPWTDINPLYHLAAGGFAFGIVYMATDPVSAPGTNTSKWFYGFFIGMLTVLIRVFNPAYPEGVMMAILFMNLFAPLFDFIEIRMRVSKRIPNV
ncbi:MAG: NADH:ubiquinone reductase (Na(+)-transporting) subunit B [Desulfobacteraceae bacterium]|nr:NADH:ubiquinone reductase (Na(+)-transporting) subunit B [Desulfobacteraceae bacterium]MBC2756891.1 NADH:ubiquinone reductase (Na(+)-transporting) subunit B [Desulfobacteraceae bacterium]